MGRRHRENKITCYYQNVRGLNTKINSFYNAVATLDFDVIAITETWLGPQVHDNELFHGDYDVFRSDRNFSQLGLSRVGGALIAVKSCHRAVRVDLGHIFVDLPSVDIVATKLSLQGRAFLIFCVYIPPLFNLDRYQLLFDAFCSLKGFCESNTLIDGDFNISTFGNQFNSPNPCRL